MFGTLGKYSLKQGRAFGVSGCRLKDQALGYRDGRDRAETHPLTTGMDPFGSNSFENWS